MGEEVEEGGGGWAAVYVDKAERASGAFVVVVVVVADAEGAIELFEVHDDGDYGYNDCCY